MKRREFFGAAAATSVAVALPGRAFVRTMEDRDVVVTSFKGDTPLVFRLYDGDRLVHEETRTLSSVKRDGATHVGISASETFTFPKDTQFTRLALALPSIPEHEVPLALPNNFYLIGKSDTLTLQGDPVNGFLEIS